MKKSYKKLTQEELEVFIHNKKTAHVHKDKTKQIYRKRKYKLQ